jgi:hypothetical protein
MVVVAWKRPVIGGILLIAWALFRVVWLPVAVPTTSLHVLLPMMVRSILFFNLPLLASGILFLLSRKTERAYSDERGESIPKLRWTGLVIMGLTGLFCFLYEVIHRSHTFGFSVIDSLWTALLIGGSLILLAVAAWAWPLWGSIIGVGYSLLMMTYYTIAYSEGRTLLQLLSDFRFDIIPMIVLLIGSILVLASVKERRRALTA